MKIHTPRCPRCKTQGVVDVDAQEYAALETGNLLIQDAMPTTPAPIREQLMTGIHPACWTAMMSEEER